MAWAAAVGRHPPTADVAIAFGDFTLEESQHILAEGSVLDAGLSTDNEVEEKQQEQDPAKPAPTMFKSWAHALGVTAAATTETAKTTTTTAPAASGPPRDDPTAPLAFEDAIQQALKDLDITTPAKEMKKRGLVNQGNTCFQNVIMQSVLSCPPFLNILAHISSHAAPNEQMMAAASTFKAWRHMVAFTREFEEPTLAQLQSQVASSSTELNRKAPKSIRISGYFLDVLSAFQKMRGEQEDALEFLEFFLDYLHSEYEHSGLELPASCEAQTKKLASGGSQPVPASAAIIADPFDDEWAEVGPKGKTSVLRQNQVDTTRSPINWLFKGTLRSELKQSGKKHSSITIEPFHCLHLNLDHEPFEAFLPGANNGPKPTYSIEDMMRRAFEVEVIESTMKRYPSMETLPVVLTLNIKRFTYHPELGPVKLPQFVKYPLHLAFPAQYMSSTCLAENGGNAALTKPPMYELFAVVSHLGKFVVGGHYTCVCRDNKDQWFRYDDEHVTSISEATALAENAYLLFYIRTDGSAAARAAKAAALKPATSPTAAGKKGNVWKQAATGRSSANGASSSAPTPVSAPSLPTHIPGMNPPVAPKKKHNRKRQGGDAAAGK